MRSPRWVYDVTEPASCLNSTFHDPMITPINVSDRSGGIEQIELRNTASRYEDASLHHWRKRIARP